MTSDVSVQPISQRLVNQLRQALDPHRVHTEAADIDLYKSDASNIKGRAGVVCFPVTTHEVQAIVRICAEFNQPFVARGSGTGLAGGATPIDGSVVI
jgi:glycolate oxidase